MRRWPRCSPGHRSPRVRKWTLPAARPWAASSSDPPFTWVKPLSDPVGGTELVGGRHPAKMVEPKPGKEAPKDVLHLVYGMCQTMDAGLRLYGHPQLLAIAENINGADFTPFNDAIFVKQPGLGGSVAWHQDGLTHWNSPDWNEGIHGFNFQVQLYPTTPGNCLWVVPGTHKRGKLDIKAMVRANGGSERLPDAVPLTCQPGDVTMVESPDAALLVCQHFAAPAHLPDVRVPSPRLGDGRPQCARAPTRASFTTSRRVFDRSAVIAVAIDARRQRFPDEKAYVYQPFAGLEDDFRWNPDTYERVIRDYNLKDLGI